MKVRWKELPKCSKWYGFQLTVQVITITVGIYEKVYWFQAGVSNYGHAHLFALLIMKLSICDGNGMIHKVKNFCFVKWSESCSVVSDSLRPHGLYSLWNSPGQKLEWLAFPFSRGSSQPRSPSLQADSLPFESQREPLAIWHFTKTKFAAPWSKV